MTLALQQLARDHASLRDFLGQSKKLPIVTLPSLRCVRLRLHRPEHMTAATIEDRLRTLERETGFGWLKRQSSLALAPRRTAADPGVEGAPLAGEWEAVGGHKSWRLQYMGADDWRLWCQEEVAVSASDAEDMLREEDEMKIPVVDLDVIRLLDRGDFGGTITHLRYAIYWAPAPGTAAIGRRLARFCGFSIRAELNLLSRPR